MFKSIRTLSNRLWAFGISVTTQPGVCVPAQSPCAVNLIEIHDSGGRFMARKLLILLGLFFIGSISSQAQSIGVLAGYSFEHVATSPGRNFNGIEIGAQYRLLGWLSAVADMDGHYVFPNQTDGRTFHLMVGPEISLPIPGKYSPFVHVLAGFGSIHDNGFTSSSYSAALGGGLDRHIAPLLTWRMIQADDVVTHYFGGLQHNVRLTTGVVFRF